MDFLVGIIIVGTIIGLAVLFVKLVLKKIKKNTVSKKQSIDNPKVFNVEQPSPPPQVIVKPTILYKSKQLVTQYEMTIFNKLQNIIKEDYYVFPQINLASIVNKCSELKYRTELFRNIDFGIFKKSDTQPLLMIEINDKSHKEQSRYKRDLRVREILSKAGIPLLTLYTEYPNEETYIKKRISEHLELYSNDKF